jgi:hypothetical protein
VSVRLRQAALSMPVLARVTPLGAVAGAGLAGVILVRWPGASVESLEFRVRMACVLLAAVSAAPLDDEAGMTLASSPTPLMARRLMRLGASWALVAVSWSLVLWAASPVPAAALTRELVVLAALAAVGAFLGGSVAGAAACIGWFCLSWLPPIGRLPLPPNPLDPRAARPLLLVAAVACAVVLALSRDPLRRFGRS